MDGASNAVDKLMSSIGIKSDTQDNTVTSTTSAATSGSETGVTHGNEPATAVTAVDKSVDPAPNGRVVEKEEKVVDPVLEEKTVTKEEEVVPAVEHETVKKEHETIEETVRDKERHQHHYHTTVQPLEDREVLPTEHKQEQVAGEVKEFDHSFGEDVKGKVDARNAEFQSSTEQAATAETKTKEDTLVGENVHHHIHETIQPVIEKETVQPSVTHKVIPVTEVHHDPSQDHGVTTKPVKSVEEFQRRLDGEQRQTEVVEGDAAEVKVEDPIKSV